MVKFFGTKGFANIEGKFFRTDDFGENWVPIDGPPGFLMNHMDMLGTLLFAGDWNGIYRSGDGGESWSSLPRISIVTNVQAMLVHRGALLAVLTTDSGTGMYRYSESAAAWTRLIVKPSNVFINQGGVPFAADDSALYIGGKGLIKSLDGGMTWIDLTAGLDEARKLHQPKNPYGYVHSLLVGNGALYAGVEAGVFRSADGGSTWSSMLIGSTYRFTSLALAGEFLLAGTSQPGGLWRFPLDSSPASHIEQFAGGITALCASDSGVFAGGYKGIHRSLDGGKTWSLKNPGTRTWDIGILTSRNGVMHAGGRGSPLFRSLDQGVTWGTGTDLPELQWIKSMTWNGNTLFAVSGQGTNDLYASEDGGTDWTRPGGAADSLDFEVVAAATGSLSTGTLFAAALNTRTHSHELLRSEDKGLIWRPASEPINGGRSGIYSLAFGSSASGQSLIHMGTDSGYFRIDAATGKVDASGLKGKSIFKMFAWEERLFASGEGTNLWRSLDQGLTWEKATVAVPWVENITSFGGYAQTVYAGTFGSGVYRSTNGGASWEPFNPGQLDPRVSGLVVDGARLYASTSASVYSLELEGSVSFAGRRLQSGRDGKSGKRTGSLGKGRGMPYLEILQGDGRFRILRLDGRQAADGPVGSKDGANR